LSVPVAADRDDELGTVARGTLRELDQVPRSLREERLALDAELVRAMHELGPALPGRAVARRRIDEEDDRTTQGC